jgi:hypothetical protein
MSNRAGPQRGLLAVHHAQETEQQFSAVYLALAHSVFPHSQNVPPAALHIIARLHCCGRQLHVLRERSRGHGNGSLHTGFATELAQLVLLHVNQNTVCNGLAAGVAVDQLRVIPEAAHSARPFAFCFNSCAAWMKRTFGFAQLLTSLPVP